MTISPLIVSLQQDAIMWWPEDLKSAADELSPIPRLLETQDSLISVLQLTQSSPTQFIDLLKESSLSANVFLKHLCVLADFGGEPIQRLGRSFDEIFDQKNGSSIMQFTWKGDEHTYFFKDLPTTGLNTTKLTISNSDLAKERNGLSAIQEDMAMILIHGANSTSAPDGQLDKCIIGDHMGDKELLERFIRERYIWVSRQTSGATANSLGQVLQQKTAEKLKQLTDDKISICSNKKIKLSGYEKPEGMPFDVVAEGPTGQKVGIEVSFQVTTNSTIERKAGQAANRQQLMHGDGHNIAYIIDGAGNFQRHTAITNIYEHSDLTVNYSEESILKLASWISRTLA